MLLWIFLFHVTSSLSLTVVDEAQQVHGNIERDSDGTYHYQTQADAIQQEQSIDNFIFVTYDENFYATFPSDGLHKGGVTVEEVDGNANQDDGSTAANPEQEAQPPPTDRKEESLVTNLTTETLWNQLQRRSPLRRHCGRDSLSQAQGGHGGGGNRNCNTSTTNANPGNRRLRGKT